MDVKEVYLKCNILSPGLFSGQYIVNFVGSEKSYSPSGELMVFESSLIKKDENSGLVKATLVRKDKDSSVVIVKDNEQGGVFSSVPNKEIVFEKN